MADLDPISGLRPIHPNQQRQPRKKEDEKKTSKEPPKKPRDDSDHQVDDYA